MHPDDVEEMAAAVVEMLGDVTTSTSIPAEIGAWIADACRYSGATEWRMFWPIGPGPSGIGSLMRPAPDGTIGLTLTDADSKIFWHTTLRPAPLRLGKLRVRDAEAASGPGQSQPVPAWFLSYLAETAARYDELAAERADDRAGSTIMGQCADVLREALAQVGEHVPGAEGGRRLPIERAAAAAVESNSGVGWWPPREAGPIPGADHHDEGTGYCTSLPEHGDELHPHPDSARHNAPGVPAEDDEAAARAAVPDDQLAPPCVGCGSRLRYACAPGCAGRQEPDAPAPASLADALKASLAAARGDQPDKPKSDTGTKRAASSRRAPKKPAAAKDKDTSDAEADAEKPAQRRTRRKAS
jgi:hypothetical protein